METSLDNKLMERAKESAKKMLISGAEAATFDGFPGDGPTPTFHVRRSAEGMMVLGRFEEGGVEFNLGIEI